MNTNDTKVSKTVSGVQSTPFDLECTDLVRRFETFTAVDQLSFSIPQGSFFSILGPSGCGKTTLLRMLAGFDEPSSGDIKIKGKSVKGVPPNKRPANMVFQHLALFPMMTVSENIAYGLKRRGVDKPEIARKVQEVLEKVRLPDSGIKKITQLSGGQKQRIAIARCLVLEPSLLLLDEPLGALDLKLREEMKVELKQLQHEVGTTFIYITHDQSEALVMSDTVAVMNNGRFEQVGSPQELYYQPSTSFVANFVGDANRWQGKVVSVEAGRVSLETNEGFQMIANAVEGSSVNKGEQAEMFVRPEAVTLSREMEPKGDNRIFCSVKELLFNGASSRVIVRDDKSGELLTVNIPQTGEYANLQRDEKLQVFWTSENTRFFGVA